MATMYSKDHGVFFGYYLYVEQNKIDLLALGPIFGIVISWLQNKKIYIDDKTQ